MDEKEKELEQLAVKLENYSKKKHLPIYEVYITFFSILTSSFLFLFPSIMDVIVYKDGEFFETYHLLTNIMPVWGYAIMFFTAGITKTIGLLFSKNSLRYIGLGISAGIYALFTACLLITFPSLLLLVFFVMTIFTMLSIGLVKYTSIGMIDENSNHIFSKQDYQLK